MFPIGNCQVCLGIIRKITGELTSTLDFEEVLHHIVRLTSEAMRVKGCALRLLNEKTRKFELSAAWGLSQVYLAKGPIDANHSIVSCMEGEIVQIQDVTTDLRIQYPEAAKIEGIVSILSVPMVLRNQVVGVLRLYTSELRHFKSEEHEYIRTLADLGTLALEHARLYSALKADHSSLIEDFHHWFEDSAYKPTELSGEILN
jgi:signal transduction protein with GAF and PtsI domain